MAKKMDPEKKANREQKGALAKEMQGKQKGDRIYFCIIAGLTLLLLLEVFGIV